MVKFNDRFFGREKRSLIQPSYYYSGKNVYTFLSFVALKLFKSTTKFEILLLFNTGQSICAVPVRNTGGTACILPFQAELINLSINLNFF